MQNHELNSAIKKLYNLLQDVPDDSESTVVFVHFLRTFLRLNSKNPLPTIEVMTIIKHQKPTVFYMMRKLSKQDTMLEMLTGLSMELEKAEQHLEAIIN